MLGESVAQDPLATAQRGNLQPPEVLRALLLRYNGRVARTRSGRFTDILQGCTTPLSKHLSGTLLVTKPERSSGIETRRRASGSSLRNRNADGGSPR